MIVERIGEETRPSRIKKFKNCYVQWKGTKSRQKNNEGLKTVKYPRSLLLMLYRSLGV